MRLTVLAFCCCILGAPARAEIVDHEPGPIWEHMSAADQGWDSGLLKQAYDWSQVLKSSAVMIVQHGVVVAEWGDTEKRMELASVRKSLLDALIGIAVARYQIDLTATMCALDIDDNPPGLNEQEKQATVLDLLQARSGIYHAALYETPAMAARRPPRFSHAPGTYWYYNNWDFNVLGTIYEHSTGTSIFQSLAREIGNPIGMQDYTPADGEYFKGAASIHPAYPIRMSARDLARFALLYLHDGRWGERQVVPAQWVHDSTTAHSDTGFGPGYGYLWWTGFLDDSIAPSVNLPPGSFFAWGAGGQYAFVIPALDLIVVHRIDRDVPNYRETGLRDMGRLLWLILSADHQTDIGPDASLAASHGQRLKGEALETALKGAAFQFGEKESDGPYVAHFNANGSFAFTSGTPQHDAGSGTWEVKNDRFCRTFKDTRCYSVVSDGSSLEFFDRDGLMQYAMHRQP